MGSRGKETSNPRHWIKTSGHCVAANQVWPRMGALSYKLRTCPECSLCRARLITETKLGYNLPHITAHGFPRVSALSRFPELVMVPEGVTQARFDVRWDSKCFDEIETRRLPHNFG